MASSGERVANGGRCVILVALTSGRRALRPSGRRRRDVDRVATSRPTTPVTSAWPAIVAGRSTDRSRCTSVYYALLRKNPPRIENSHLTPWFASPVPLYCVVAQFYRDGEKKRRERDIRDKRPARSRAPRDEIVTRLTRHFRETEEARTGVRRLRCTSQAVTSLFPVLPLRDKDCESP